MKKIFFLLAVSSLCLLELGSPNQILGQTGDKITKPTAMPSLETKYEITYRSWGHPLNTAVYIGNPLAPTETEPGILIATGGEAMKMVSPRTKYDRCNHISLFYNSVSRLTYLRKQERFGRCTFIRSTIGALRISSGTKLSKKELRLVKQLFAEADKLIRKTQKDDLNENRQEPEVSKKIWALVNELTAPRTQKEITSSDGRLKW